MFPYLVIDDDIMGVISKWLSDWLTPSDVGARTSKTVEGIATTTEEKYKKKEAQKAYVKENATVKEKVALQKEAFTKEREVSKEKVSAKKIDTPKEKTTTSQVTIDFEELECTDVEVETRDEEKGGANLESPFILKKRQKWSSMGPHKKQKSDKTASATPLVLMEGDLDEIGDVARNTIENICNHIEGQYHQALDKV